MSTPGAIEAPSPSDPLVRRVRAGWRSLTGGSAVRDPQRATLVACSGGADSAALLLALADRKPTVAHIVHDLRPGSEARGDRDATHGLARALGLTFVESRVSVKSSAGNAEALARRARYRALEALARAQGLRYVATGHHADDQLETLLLRLCRGAGVNGMRGIAPHRRIGQVELIRPMLGVRRAECEALCARCGYAWRLDATNEDLSLARAALRARVMPALAEIEPRAATNSGRVARHMRAAAAHLRSQALKIVESAHAGERSLRWERACLRDADEWVLGEALRVAAARLGSDHGNDRLGSKPVGACVRAIRDARGGERTLPCGRARIIVRREEILMEVIDDGR